MSVLVNTSVILSKKTSSQVSCATCMRGRGRRITLWIHLLGEWIIIYSCAWELILAVTVAHGIVNTIVTISKPTRIVFVFFAQVPGQVY